MGVGGRLLGWRKPGQDYASFIEQVEPELLSAARLHRFAEPALLLGPPGPPPGVSVVDALGSQAMAPATGKSEWVLQVDRGYRLHPEAVLQFARAIASAGDASVITCDHDRLDAAGARHSPALRPGPSPDRASAPSPVRAVRRSARAGHAHLPLILAHRVGDPEERPSPPSAPEPTAAAAEPSVEVVVCLRDQPALLERSAGALLSTTGYDRLTLRLVDNASARPETAQLLRRLAAVPRVTVDHDPRPFNFSALNHAAAQRSEADVLVFLNNDTEVTDPRWIDALLAHAVRPEVGAVAPLLLYPNGRVQHAGVAIGLHGWAGHPFAGLKPDERTPFGAAADGTRNWMAVTAACLMVERRKYLEVGGFDSVFQVGGGDVDLCLRLTAAGYRSLCVPGTTVIHDESATRDPAKIPPGDFDASRRSYGAFRTVGDPFYHPALTLQDTTCRLRGPGEPDPPQ